MVRKHAAFVAAGLLSFAGVLAFVLELSGKPGDRLWIEDHLVADSVLLAPKLTPMEMALLYPRKLAPLPPEKIDTETLWLARAIYSETKRPEEQLLVAWVVRNRVETAYRGKRTYRDVVLDPYQFSAFLPDYHKRPYYAGLSALSSAPGWQKALRIAYTVRSLDPIYRPFSVETRHFFSERSMPEGQTPAWARDILPVNPERAFDIDEQRFRFFEGIS